MNGRQVRRLDGALVVVALVALHGASGCRHHGDFKKQYQEMRPNMARGNWPVAAKQLEAARDKIYKEDDRVMFWLNMGTVLHYAGDFTGSQGYFVKAESAMQDLWTKSITGEASKFAVSETLSAYPGEDFEKVLLYLYTSLNNVRQGKTSDALVEARRADEFLKKMLVHYDKEGEVGTIYRQDAFVLWLVGLFYEVEGSWNDAYLAYRSAHEAYEKEYAGKFGAGVPSYLWEDLVRTAELAGLKEDAQRWRKKGSGSSLQALANNMAEVILIHGSGEAPYKQELIVQSVLPDGYVLRVALPQFVEVKYRIAGAELRGGGQMARTELAEPVARIALKNFEHRLPAIQARAIARATVKYAATKGAEAIAGKGSTAGMLAKLVGNVAAAVSEAADLRAWTTLPGEIGVTRVWVPAGAHTLEVTYLGSSGGPLGKAQPVEVELKPGERRIVSMRTLD